MPHLCRCLEPGLPPGRTGLVRARILLALALADGLCGMSSATTASAGEASRTQPRSLEEIVVTAKRDEAIRQQVERALHEDRYVVDEHITVSIKDGVVTLSGLVFDDWDIRTAKRVAKRIPGVKRVVNDLEIEVGGD